MALEEHAPFVSLYEANHLPQHYRVSLEGVVKASYNKTGAIWVYLIDEVGAELLVKLWESNMGRPDITDGSNLRITNLAMDHFRARNQQSPGGIDTRIITSANSMPSSVLSVPSLSTTNNTGILRAISE